MNFFTSALFFTLPFLETAAINGCRKRGAISAPFMPGEKCKNHEPQLPIRGRSEQAPDAVCCGADLSWHPSKYAVDKHLLPDQCPG